MADLQRFANVVAREDFSPAEAFLAFARAEYPELDERAYLDRIEALADEAKADLHEAGSAAGALEALGGRLVAAGFRGNDEEYYDPRNSFLNDVLDRKLGLPISLSVIWMEVGRRTGLPVVGIGMPLHFLVGLEGVDVCADPFNGGRLLTRDEAIHLFGELSQGRVPWREEFLAPAPSPEIVRRALTNLKSVYGSTGDLRRALWVEDHLLVVPGAEPSERRERAAVLAALGRHPEAIGDLRVYLESGPEDADEAQAEIRRLVAAMN